MNLRDLCDLYAKTAESNREGMDKKAFLAGAAKWIMGNKMKTFVGASFAADAASSAEKFTALANKNPVPGLIRSTTTM